MIDVSRRQLLAATGVGLGIATAGCAGAGSGGDRTVTVFLRPSEEYQSDLEEIGSELRQRNINQSEAQRQASEIYDDILETAETEARSRNITINDTYEPERRPPILLVSGSSNDLVSYLNTDIVNAFVDSERFEELTQNQQQPQQTQTNQTAEQSD